LRTLYPKLEGEFRLLISLDYLIPRSYSKVLYTPIRHPENTTPILIELTYPEFRDNNTKEWLLAIFERKLSEMKKIYGEQYKTWDTSHDFDLPKNGKTACLLIAVPENALGKLTGIEANFAQLAKIYTERYQAEISAVCMQRETEWLDIISKREIAGLPRVAPATKESILKHINSTLRRAIDEEKETVVIHYMMHGGTDGTMDAEDGGFSARAIAQEISKLYKGKPMCSQIRIVILPMPSCFSGSQAEQIVETLKTTTTLDGKRITVKDCNIICDSSNNTPSDCGVSSYNALIPNSEVLVSAYSSAASIYYLSLYYDLIDYLKSEKAIISSPVGTFAHAMRFSDLMSNSSFFRQDLQWWFYSYDPEQDQEEKRLFSTNERPHQRSLTSFAEYTKCPSSI